MKKVVLALSGGMDSATLLGFLLSKGVEVHCCNFQYGSKHNAYEFHTFSHVFHFYLINGFRDKIDAHIFNLVNTFKSFDSDLLQSGGAIPEGHYEAESMKQTVVPGRNLIFASIMTGLAQSIGADTIALGVHAGDHHIYPDCRKDFIHSLNITINFATEEKVSVYAPFLDMNKADILKIGYNLTPQVPYQYTRTCYKNQSISCGKCGACQERLEAFKLLGKEDPIEYER